MQEQEQEQEQQVSIAPLPPTPRTGGIDFADESLHAPAATSGTPAAAGGVTRLDQDSVENYDLEETEEEEEDKPPPLNVYLNYQTFKLETFAMNHFSPPPKKIKKDTWTKILSFSKVSF